uniref:Uncharacterized protein n=1 Tax=Oryza glaberrima TaxID=4538 RepID=I1PK94_ORYGL
MAAWCPGWAVVSPAWRRPEGGLATSGKEAGTARRMGGADGDEHRGLKVALQCRGRRSGRQGGWGKAGAAVIKAVGVEEPEQRRAKEEGWEEGTLRPRWVMGRMQRRRSHGSRRRPWAAVILPGYWHPSSSSGKGRGVASTTGTRRWLGWCGGGDEEPAMEAVIDRERGGGCDGEGMRSGGGGVACRGEGAHNNDGGVRGENGK